jgi:aryl-alcohol dehydrogenase-like predicted oxidoreductase
MTAEIPTATRSGAFLLGGDRRVHRLGFGAMRITGPGIWGPPRDRPEAIAVLRRAIALDITLIDTAASYGPHISEALIAEALFPYPASLVIATKGGLDRPGPDRWTSNGRPEHLRADLEGSLRRLRVDCITLYQLHRVDPGVPEADQFGVFQRFKEEGKIQHVGLSEVTVDQIERARAFFPVASVQNRHNLAEREWEAVVDYCDSRGIAFIPWSPLLEGTIGRHRGALGRIARLIPRSARLVGKIGTTDGALARIAERHHATPSQIAIAWLLRRSPVMLPIPGTSRVAHLEENVAAAGITLSDDEFAALADSAGG